MRLPFTVTVTTATEELSALLKRLFRCHFQSAAARHFHTHNGHASDVVVSDDLRQLFGIIHAVQLGTSYEGDMPSDEPLVKCGVGVSRAVGGNQQFCTVKIGCVNRNELDLDRPL